MTDKTKQQVRIWLTMHGNDHERTAKYIARLINCSILVARQMVQAAGGAV